MLRKKPETPTPKLFGLQPPRKQKKPLERLWRRIELRLSRKTPAQHVEAMSTRIAAAFRGELAGIMACTLLAKKTLDTTRQVELPFPDDIFDAAVPMDEASRARLSTYVAALEEFHERCLEAQLPLSMATSTGVEVWIASAHGLLHPELKAKVGQFWARLAQMESELPEATRLLLRREPSEVDRVYFHYRPKALLS